jgi:hypothetical protein
MGASRYTIASSQSATRADASAGKSRARRTAVPLRTFSITAEACVVEQGR